MNFKGHASTSMVVDGEKKNHSHNNWIQFGYTYGLLSMFFYGVKKCNICFFDTGNLYRICYCYTDGMFVSAV